MKKQKQAKLRSEESKVSNDNKAKRVGEPEAMVQCQACKVYLPQSNALSHERRFYCSKKHRDTLDSEGWIGNAFWRVSPNQDLRPENTQPDLVVIHHISLPPSEFRNRNFSHCIVDLFHNKLDPNAHPYFAEIADQKVSSHFLINRSGELFQFVSTHNKAWHAGVSSFLGREMCNDFSIGIELEGDGDAPFEDVQYQALVQLIQKLESDYPHLQFAGHSDIAPDRKTDPGIYFDWEKFRKDTQISTEKMPFGLEPR